MSADWIKKAATLWEKNSRALALKRMSLKYVPCKIPLVKANFPLAQLKIYSQVGER